jgi:hypothetical protein
MGMGIEVSIAFITGMDSGVDRDGHGQRCHFAIIMGTARGVEKPSLWACPCGCYIHYYRPEHKSMHPVLSA